MKKSTAELVAALAVIVASVPPARADDVLPPQIVHQPCEVYQKGKKFEVVARFYDDSPIFDPKVVYRSGKDETWKNAPFNKAPDSENFRATIKAKDLHGPLEYFIETFDENGNGPARMGSPEAPIRVLPSENAPACAQVGDAESAPLTSDVGSKPPEPGTATVERIDAFTATSGTRPPGPVDECRGPDAPLTCSPFFWVGLSVGIAAVIAIPLVILAATGVFDSPPETPPGSDFVDVNVVGGDPTTATWPLVFGGSR